MSLKKFVIERDIQNVGELGPDELSGAAETSNGALCQIGAKNIQWVQSYVAGDKTFCFYLATDKAAIEKHAEPSGFPASKITEIVTVIDPTTAR